VVAGAFLDAELNQ